MNTVVAHPVFVEAGHDAVAGSGHLSVEFFLGSSQPVGPFPKGICIGAQGVAYVEITVSQWFLFHTGGNPVGVHAESPKHYLAIVPTEEIVYRE